MLPAFPIVDERALKILVMSIPVRVIYALIRSPHRRVKKPRSAQNIGRREGEAGYGVRAPAA
jgi:hypothetical protein